jgi:integrase
MPREPRGECVRTGDGHSARITVIGRERRTYALALSLSDSEAHERTAVLARLASHFRRAGMVGSPTVLKLLDMAASASKALLPGILQTAQELLGGELVATGTEPKTPTFRDVAKLWTSGELHRDYPDHVKAKDSELDESRLKLLSSVDVGGLELGDVPVDRFTLEHAEAAMRKLPERAKRPGTRRHYAQLIARVLSLAVYPLRLIAVSPLPAGFKPKVGKPPAFAYLYPDEDAQLMACSTVPMNDRLFYGFLTREGMRAGEAIRLQWRDLDLERGTVSLDRNKTDDARSWALDAGVVRALREVQNERRPKPTELVFLDAEGCPFDVTQIARRLRAHLTTAGVKRLELHDDGTNRRKLRAHDLRGTFVTLALANGKTEAWVADRTGHRSSQMINRYRRSARSAKELGLGCLAPLDHAVRVVRIPAEFPLGEIREELTEAQEVEIIDESRSGGTGRRGGLKIRCSQGLVGSIPTFGTAQWCALDVQ